VKYIICICLFDFHQLQGFSLFYYPLNRRSTKPPSATTTQTLTTQTLNSKMSATCYEECISRMLWNMTYFSGKSVRVFHGEFAWALISEIVLANKTSWLSHPVGNNSQKTWSSKACFWVSPWIKIDKQIFLLFDEYFFIELDFNEYYHNLRTTGSKEEPQPDITEKPIQ